MGYPKGRYRKHPDERAPKKSYYKPNPWLTYGTPQFDTLAKACYEFYKEAKFPIATDDAVEMILEKSGERAYLESPAALELFGQPKNLIGRFLTQNFHIYGRQLRRNGVRSRFYVIMKPKETEESMQTVALMLGLGE